MREKVEYVLDQIRPSLQADGGDVELVDVTDGIVKVKLKGTCSGCPFSTLTVKQVIEHALKEKLPEIREVISV